MKSFRVGDPEIGEFYRANGYVCLQDMVQHSLLERVRDEILLIFETAFGEPGGGFELLKAAYFDERKPIWQSCAKRMHMVLPIQEAVGSQRVESTLKQCGLLQPSVSTFAEVRTDMPGDSKYMQPWHQDWRYGQSSYNSVTIWTPLHDVTREHGAVALVPRTHLNGLYPYKERLSPRAFLIDEADQFDHLEHVVAAIPFGHSIIFSQFLVHGSLPNVSGEMRLTFQMRFADLQERNFVRNQYRVPIGSELVWPDEPRAEDVRAAFA